MLNNVFYLTRYIQNVHHLYILSLQHLKKRFYLFIWERENKKWGCREKQSPC